MTLVNVISFFFSSNRRVCVWGCFFFFVFDFSYDETCVMLRFLVDLFRFVLFKNTVNIVYSNFLIVFLLLLSLCSSNCSPFVHKQHIIDAYVQYHYLEFVKLYNAKDADTRTMTLVKLVIRITYLII